MCIVVLMNVSAVLNIKNRQSSSPRRGTIKTQTLFEMFEFFDFFQKQDDDIVRRSSLGGLVTLICYAAILFLFYRETREYFYK
jgi:hypothetical protein